jgi:hypothetical protein
MNLSVYESIAVSEHFIHVYPPALYQTNLGIISGNTYRLSFDTEITSGVLNIFQGSQLIYSSVIVFLGVANTLFETIQVRERVTIDKRTRIDLFDTISLSESITMTGTKYISVSDTATVSENFTKT